MFYFNRNLIEQGKNAMRSLSQFMVFPQLFCLSTHIGSLFFMYVVVNFTLQGEQAMVCITLYHCFLSIHLHVVCEEQELPMRRSGAHTTAVHT